MILFAAPIGGLIHLIILLVAFGVWVINTLLRKRDEEGESQTRQMPPRQRAQAGVNPMEPHDVDQFLDEVLGRGRPVPQAGQPPAGQPPNVIVLRPGGPPPPPPQRRPPQQRRPQRPVAQRPAQARGGRQVQPPAQQQASKRSAFAQSISDSVDQAAAATGSAGAATTEAAALKDSTRTAGRQASIGNDILAMMRSPVDVRRALVLREILGPPLALRRRKR
jgi:hypothetical protein